MKLVRTIAMHTDHSFYGTPIETSRVTLYCNETLTPAQIEMAKYNQEMKLRSMAKRMPHSYWQNNARSE
jgi:hypothetical protein